MAFLDQRLNPQASNTELHRLHNIMFNCDKSLSVV